MESNPLFRLKLLLCNQSVTEFMMFGGSLLKNAHPEQKLKIKECRQWAYL